MNIRLDMLLRTFLQDPSARESALSDLGTVSRRMGLPVADVRAAVDGDLGSLYERGAHPLLVMKLAGQLGVDPSAWSGQLADEQREQTQDRQ